MNAEDRGRLEQLYVALMRQVETAQPGSTISLVVRLNRRGHVSEASAVIPAELRPLGVESL